MAAISTTRQLNALPEGYVAIPISTGQKAAPVRVSVLARREPDPVAGHLVLIRQTADAKVYLGALIDAGGRVHMWLELWVQSLDAVAQSLFAWRESLSNALLDQRWQRQAELLTSLASEGAIRTGWESRHPLPLWLDVAKAEPVAPTDSTGETWKLCQDDGLLSTSNLPAFSSTLHRYLYLSKKGAEAGFVPITPDAPTNDNTRGMDVLLGGRTDLVPLNPAAGLLLVRELVGMSLESYVDLLASAAAPKLPVISHGKGTIQVLGGDGLAGDGAWLFLGGDDKWGRVLEGFYLRLRALHDVVTAARESAKRTHAPLLNLEPGRFQVRVSPAGGTGLPTLWSAKTLLVEPSDTVEVQVEEKRKEDGGAKKDAKGADAHSSARFFLPGRTLPASVYRPGGIGHAGDVEASVRVRQVKVGSDGAVIEGTLVTQERIEASPQDMVRLWLPLGSTRVRLHAHCEAPSGMALGERRIRTLPAQLPDDLPERLKAAEGVTIPNVRFEVLPLLAEPWDLYSLAVISVRALLVNSRNSLAVALDELLSFARQVAAKHDPAAPLRVRLRDVYESDKRFADALGRHRLLAEGDEGDGDAVPAELWWDVLAMLVKAFPGIGHDSTFKSYGDAAPAGATAFDSLAADLENLLLRARSLILVDWRQNREVGGVLRDAMRRLSSGGAVGTAASTAASTPAAPVSAAAAPPGAQAAPPKPARRAPAETPFR